MHDDVSVGSIAKMASLGPRDPAPATSIGMQPCALLHRLPLSAEHDAAMPGLTEKVMLV